MRTLPILTAATSTLALTATASAATITVTPETPGVSGSPRVADDSPGARYGSTSLQNTNTASKAEVYLTPEALQFTTPVTMGDLASISYWTKGPLPSREDWFLHIYTNPEGTANDNAGWYGRRITHDTNAAVTGSGWRQSVVSAFTVTGGSVVDGGRKFTNDNRSDPFGYSIADPLPADIADDTIKFFTFSTNSGLNAADGDSLDALLDGLEVSLTNGESVLVDFAAVPEPASALALLAGGGLLLRRRR